MQVPVVVMMEQRGDPVTSNCLALGQADCLIEQVQGIRFVCPTPPQHKDDPDLLCWCRGEDAPLPTPDEGERYGEGGLAVGGIKTVPLSAPTMARLGSGVSLTIRGVTGASHHLLNIDLDSDVSCPEWRTVTFSPSSDTTNSTLLVVFMSLQQIMILFDLSLSMIAGIKIQELKLFLHLFLNIPETSLCLKLYSYAQKN
jgi:hypothetical protein